jgi:hypothetical protein
VISCQPLDEPPGLDHTPLSALRYYTHMQLPFMAGGRLYNPRHAVVTGTHLKHKPSCQFPAVALLCSNSQLIKLHEKRLPPLTRASLYTIVPNVAPLHTNSPLLVWSGRSLTLKITAPSPNSNCSYLTFILCASFSTFGRTQNVNPLSCLESFQANRKCGNVAISEN